MSSGVLLRHLRLPYDTVRWTCVDTMAGKQHHEEIFALALLFLTVSALIAAPPGVKVWAIGEPYRIEPLSGRAFEVNPLLFPESPAGNLSETNVVWNGAARKISLRAARNEIVGFQLIIEKTAAGKLADVNISVSDFAGPEGARLGERNIDLFKEWYVNVVKRSAQNYSLGTGWYADALIPVSHWTGRLFPRSYVMPFDIPDLMNNISQRQSNHAFWIDIYVPKDRRDAPPGIYRSKVTVTSAAGSITLDLELAVWDFMLPEENHLAGNIHTDTEINTFAPELELKYYQLMRRHRLAMGVLGYAPDIEISGTEVKFDWTKYDERLAKYLDGRAFTKEFGYTGPGYGIPIEMLVLPFDVYPINVYFDSRHVGYPYGKEWKFYKPWPVAVPKSGITPEYSAIWKNAFRGFEKHIEEHPAWSRTKPIVFLLSLDESYDEASVKQMLYYGGLLKESGAKRLKFRIDGSYPMDTMDRLVKVVDIVILGVRAYVPERVRQLRSKGVEDWFYTGMGITDADPLGCRALGWVSWKYGARSWTIWELDFNSLRAWQYPETYSQRNGDVQNGQGFLVYRGETMGLDEPVASIRLKLLRRGSQDYEYLRLLAQQPGGAKLATDIVNSIIHEPMGKEGAWGSPGMWNHNAEDWERARYRIGDLIEKLQRQ